MIKNNIKKRSNGFSAVQKMLTQCEHGRSMVEMLCVLAVIDVLSATGVYGYTIAMNKHRANELLNEASKRAVVCMAQIQSDNTPSVSDFGAYDGYSFTVVPNPANANQFQLTLLGKNIPEAICNNMKNTVGSSTPVRDIIADCNNASSMVLTYNNDMSATIYPSDYNGNQSACTGAGKKYCTGSNTCVESGADCTCSGIVLNQCQEGCDPLTGEILNKADETPCKNCEGNVCHLGTCIEGQCQDIITPDCKWSDWYDGTHPEPGTSGGDFETFENLRKRGYQICNEPLDIECQAQLFPGMPLEKLEQKVTCDKNSGLTCLNSEQSPPLCYNYKLRVYCCDEAAPIIECKEGTFLDATGECVPPQQPCPEHAFSCDADGSNLKCMGGYYYDRDVNQCLPCDGANEYSSQIGAEHCSICYGDALVNADHTGCICEAHAICSDDLSGRIIGCEQGYFLSNGHCI